MTNSHRKTFAALGALLLIATIATPAFAQFFSTGRVPARDTHTWRVFAPEGPASVIVDGDGDTDLDCWVYDQFGNELGEDTDSTDLCIIGFDHPSSGELTIRIRNYGRVYNDYAIWVD